MALEFHYMVLHADDKEDVFGGNNQLGMLPYIFSLLHMVRHKGE